MRRSSQKSEKFRTGKKAGIWLALCFALGLHAIFLLLPVSGQLALKKDRHAPIQLQLTTFKAQAPIATPEPEPPLPEPVQEPVSEPLPEPATNPVARQAEVEPVEALRPPLTTNRVAREPQPDLDKMTAPEKSVLTSIILARQFISEESVTDKLFGRPLVQNSGELQKEFHYPLRPDLLEMLDQPVPDLPFAYTPGLIYFAYDPGVKGDLQRFWDVITPEFGWRTRYGTEVKCVLVLVIVGCGWK